MVTDSITPLSLRKIGGKLTKKGGQGWFCHQLCWETDYLVINPFVGVELRQGGLGYLNRDILRLVFHHVEFRRMGGVGVSDEDVLLVRGDHPLFTPGMLVSLVGLPPSRGSR